MSDSREGSKSPVEQNDATNGDLQSQIVTMNAMFATLHESVRSLERRLATAPPSPKRLRTCTAEAQEVFNKGPDAIKWRLAGNEHRYTFAHQVRSKLTTIDAAIHEADSAQDFATIQDLIQAFLAHIEMEMKHIRIADRSPYGWKTVAEYKEDQLASDPTDAAAMRKAEKRAKETIEMERKKKMANHASERQWENTGVSSSPSRQQNKSQSRPRKCHFCQSTDHFIKECPYANGKPSTSGTNGSKESSD